VLCALSTFVLAYWIGSRLQAGALPVALCSLALGLAVAALAARHLRQPQRQLIWDGAAWAVESAQGGRQAGQVTLMLDLGRWMLVRFAPAELAATLGRAPPWLQLWLPLSSRDAGASWSGLRAALYALPAQGDTPGMPRRSPPAA
jgi:hypothetical protein